MKDSLWIFVFFSTFTFVWVVSYLAGADLTTRGPALGFTTAISVTLGAIISGAFLEVFGDDDDC